MKIKRSKASLNVSWIVVVVLLILLYSSYFLIYIPRQELMVKKRGFRILEEYAGNMHKKLDYYQTHVSNYSPYYVLRSYLPNLLKAFNGRLSKEESDQIIEVINGLEKDIIFSADSISEINKYVEKNGISYIEIPINSTAEIHVSRGELRDGLLKGSAFIPFNALMQNLQFDRLFQNIALLDANGVIHNSNGSVVHGISNFEALKDTLSKTQGGVFTEIELQGVKMHLMILPFKFLNDSFCLAGMITDKDFSRKTRTINSQLLTLFSGILLLLLICMPVLKIIFINRKERLNVRDAYNTTISFILGSSLLTLLFFGSVKNYLIDNYRNHLRIQNISDILAGNINRDLNRIYNLADTVMAGIYLKKDQMWKEVSNDSVMYTNDSLIYRDSIPFNEILFMDEDGKVAKAVTRTAFSNLVQLDLSQRNYYKSLTKNSKLAWPWKDSAKGPFEKFYIESIKSYNTGNKETAISFKLKKPVTTELRQNSSTINDVAPYLAITSHIPSVYDQVLPKDIAFVVIDKKGEVMFHSNQSKILQENFLIECNQNAKILGAIEYRTVEKSRIVYNEQQWLAQIVPLQNVPLFHVTLINLQYNENKNTRLYLFTFYFILFTFLTVIVGMQIIQRLGTKKKFLKNNNWSFEFLTYNKSKVATYHFLFFIQSLVLLLQLLFLFFNNQPVSALSTQIIFIAFTGFLSYFLLKDDSVKRLKILIPVIILIILAIVVVFGFVNWIVALGILLAILLLTLLARSYHLKNKPSFHFNRFLKARSVYLAYMFVWLLSIAPIPVFVYYFTINSQEQKLTQKAEMINLAKQNLALDQSPVEYINDKWQKYINGSHIDGYEVEHVEMVPTKTKIDSLINSVTRPLTRTDTGLFRVYGELRSPLTNDDYLMALLPPVNKTADWFSGDSLIYTSPSQEGEILVFNKKEDSNEEPLVLIVLYSIPLFFLFMILWYVYVYLADLVLGALTGKWKYPKIPGWQSIISKDYDCIMLIVFEAGQYWEVVSDKYTRFNASEILEKDDSLEKKMAAIDKIWLSGLGEYLVRRKKTEDLLPRLKELFQLKNKKVIVELPYDQDFIQEYLEDQVVLYGKNEEELPNAEYLNELKFLFSDFYRYTGSIDKKKIEKDLSQFFQNKDQSIASEQQILADAHLMKLKYSHIWNNLNRLEKLILFDLADDGMINFKNRFLINRLKMKGLLELNPVPQIFTPSFQYFLKYSVNKEETYILEQRLGKFGKWKNTRYLILLLLIPLAAFLFISQGFSIEKVVAILTGVIALFSGTMRLMDTSFFSSSSKSNT